MLKKLTEFAGLGFVLFGLSVALSGSCIAVQETSDTQQKQQPTQQSQSNAPQKPSGDPSTQPPSKQKVKAKDPDKLSHERLTTRGLKPPPKDGTSGNGDKKDSQDTAKGDAKQQK
jgi:hypothetical protein